MSAIPKGALKVKRVALFGVSFETGNLGVSALSEGAIGAILDCAPDAAISILEGRREPGQVLVEYRGEKVEIEIVNMRFSKRLFQSNHILLLI